MTPEAKVAGKAKRYRPTPRTPDSSSSEEETAVRSEERVERQTLAAIQAALKKSELGGLLCGLVNAQTRRLAQLMANHNKKAEEHFNNIYGRLDEHANVMRKVPASIQRVVVAYRETHSLANMKTELGLPWPDMAAVLAVLDSSSKTAKLDSYVREVVCNNSGQYHKELNNTLFQRDFLASCFAFDTR